VLSDQVGLASFLEPEDFISYPAKDVSALVARLAEANACRGTGDRAARHARIAAKFSGERVAQEILRLIETKTQP
jgi:glycosyltransferase involved in cell wall biosynthesis